MSVPADHLPTIRRLTLFAGVPRPVTDRLLKKARLQHFGSESVLFREGEASEYLHLALDSHACLKASDGQGHDYVIEFVPPGEPLILAAVILDKPFLMTAEVVRNGNVLLIPADDIRRMAETNITLSQAINRSAAAQWRGLIGQIKSLKIQTGPQRLAAFLASLVEGKSGEATVELPCERQILATWLGMVPATASRAFKELSALGVEGRGRTLKIRSVRRLKEFAAGS
jgi:CRP/FNR family transcriptional regulator, transcriptional activator FtrB